MQNLDLVNEGSVTSGRSRRSRRSTSHHGEHYTPRSPMSGSSTYRAPYFEPDLSQPSITRRHTDLPSRRSPDFNAAGTQLRLSTQPPPFTSEQAHRSSSVPDLHTYDEEHIDMNLAYGALPPDLHLDDPMDKQKEEELAVTMTKLDTLLLEAQCLHHSATTMISNLQANPEAMAAVALTLAELSNILSKMSPGIITALKGSSPAIFALLASPQFLIASGVAIGVTVVMFGGYKVIKKLQANAAATKEAYRMESAIPYEDIDLNSIDTWRRGIAEAEVQSVGTSVDGEFITPEAMRQKNERIKERAREERIVEEGSVSSERTLRRGGSESTVPRRKDVPARSSSRVAPSESGRTEKSERSRRSRRSEVVKEKEKKPKKNSALTILFKKKEKSGKRESEVSHRPRLVDL